MQTSGGFFCNVVHCNHAAEGIEGCCSWYFVIQAELLLCSHSSYLAKYEKRCSLKPFHLHIRYLLRSSPCSSGLTLKLFDLISKTSLPRFNCTMWHNIHLIVFPGFCFSYLSLGNRSRLVRAGLVHLLSNRIPNATLVLCFSFHFCFLAPGDREDRIGRARYAKGIYTSLLWYSEVAELCYSKLSENIQPEADI